MVKDHQYDLPVEVNQGERQLSICGPRQRTIITTVQMAALMAVALDLIMNNKRIRSKIRLRLGSDAVSGEGNQGSTSTLRELSESTDPE